MTSHQIRGHNRSLLTIKVGDIINVRLSAVTSQICLVRSIRLRRDGTVRSMRAWKWLERKQRVTDPDTVYPHEVVSLANPSFIPPAALQAFDQLQSQLMELQA